MQIGRKVKRITNPKRVVTPIPFIIPYPVRKKEPALVPVTPKEKEKTNGN